MKFHVASYTVAICEKFWGKKFAVFMVLRKLFYNVLATENLQMQKFPHFTFSGNETVKYFCIKTFT